MRLVFDISSIRFPLTGIGRYTYELAEALKRTAQLDEIIYCAGARLLAGLPPPSVGDEKAEGNLKRRVMGWVREVLPLAKCCVTLKHRVVARRLRSFERATVYHGTSFYLPPVNISKVVSFHDMAVFAVPETHPVSRVRLLRWVMEEAVRHADCFVTPSEFARQEIAAFFGIHPHKIRVTPLAASHRFFPISDERQVTFLAQYGLKPAGYGLFVGTIEPRKNIGLLLDAYEKLPPGLRQRFPLVICGFTGWNSDDIHSRMRSLVHQGWLHYLQFVPSDHLPRLMAGARLFLFPSLYEGFGLPPLEAMQCGVPVIVSNRASLPEVVGAAAPTLNPLDVDAWAQAIQEGLENEVWRERASQHGLNRAKLFSWERCAQETMAAYRAASSS
jgi:alpha-1,3-rhamnosyl/mannosyltransferase